MAGTKEGARKAAQTMLRRHGSDYYKKLGASGGRVGRTGGFATPYVGEDGLTGAERARIAGAKGGATSRRGKAKNRRKEEARNSVAINEVISKIRLEPLKNRGV